MKILIKLINSTSAQKAQNVILQGKLEKYLDMKTFVDFVTENFIESNGHLEATNNSFIPQIEVQDVIVELRRFSTIDLKLHIFFEDLDQ